MALDNLVKGCTDILLLNPAGTHIFTGRRCVQPQPDWWFMGGRIFPGETPIQSCQRLLRRELGLDIASERFVAVCAQAFAFGMREQEPKDHGTTDAQFCYKVQLLNEEEVKKVVEELLTKLAFRSGVELKAVRRAGAGEPCSLQGLHKACASRVLVLVDKQAAQALARTYGFF